MIRSGSVVRLQQADQVLVALDPHSHCGQCSKSGSCGISFSTEPHKTPQIVCDNPLQAKLNDQVELQISEPSSRWVLIVAIAYGVPTLGLLLGAMLGSWGATLLPGSLNPDLMAALGGLLGLCGGLFAWNTPKQRLYCQLAANVSQLRGEIVQIASE